MPRLKRITYRRDIYEYLEHSLSEFRGVVQETVTTLVDVLGASLQEIVMYNVDSEGPYWCRYDVVDGSPIERSLRKTDRSVM